MEENELDLTVTSRRNVIGAIASISLLAELGQGAAAAAPERRKIYGVYTGKDMKSYLCELKVTDPGAVIPTFQITAPGEAGRPVDGSWQDYHLSTIFGSITIMLAGELEIGVTAGNIRSVLARPGDIYVLIDTQGDGHGATRKGNVNVVTANARLAISADGLWEALSTGFTGWPDNVLPPIEGSSHHGGSLPSRYDPSRRDAR